jgi:hypothetical protein
VKLITAHELRTGAVVYWTRERNWAPRLTDAEAFEDDIAETELVTAKSQPTLVTSVYLVAIGLDGAPVAREYLRETIRANGPTVRRDLGKQAERAR